MNEMCHCWRGSRKLFEPHRYSELTCGTYRMRAMNLYESIQHALSLNQITEDEAKLAQSVPSVVGYKDADSDMLDAIEVLLDKMMQTFYATNDDTAKTSIASYTMGLVAGMLTQRKK